MMFMLHCHSDVQSHCFVKTSSKYIVIFPMANMMPFDGDDQMSTVEQKLGTGFHISINLSILYTYYID